MPPKNKGAKAKEPESKVPKEPILPPPQTVSERSTQRYHLTNPLSARIEALGGAYALTPAERQTWATGRFLKPLAAKQLYLSNKVEREVWRLAVKEALPFRRIARKDYDWGVDRAGRDLGTYKPEEFEARRDKESRLRVLESLSAKFAVERALQVAGATREDGPPTGAASGGKAKGKGGGDSAVAAAASGQGDGEEARSRGGKYELSKEDWRHERLRRKEMALLRSELYGERIGSYGQDPDWDDVEPVPQEEPVGALAAIAYSEEYADAVAYLRAVMARDEHSPRCLKLTEHVISMNPAHYTVWLYRFKIVAALALPLEDELSWLNDVAFDNLKNYQIWHHRQLLMDHHVPALSAAGGSTALTDLALSETAFLTSILAEDTKNYHVWTYRQYLVRKLNLFNASELRAIEAFITADVRNNSAWSHRFFLVFSDPAASSAGPDAKPTDPDPAVPSKIIDREVDYATEAIRQAPQNQSPWNYLRGVLAKAGRPLGTVKEFAAEFVLNLGAEEGESVTSTHALDLLADVYVEEGEREKADTALRRLAEKWDPIRGGYWNYRRQLAAQGSAKA